jgi:hypothetical protein
MGKYTSKVLSDLQQYPSREAVEPSSSGFIKFLNRTSSTYTMQWNRPSVLLASPNVNSSGVETIDVWCTWYTRSVGHSFLDIQYTAEAWTSRSIPKSISLGLVHIPDHQELVIDERVKALNPWTEHQTLKHLINDLILQPNQAKSVSSRHPRSKNLLSIVISSWESGIICLPQRIAPSFAIMQLSDRLRFRTYPRNIKLVPEQTWSSQLPTSMNLVSWHMMRSSAFSVWCFIDP